MEIIKKIMEALWTLQQAFIRCDTGAFIYGSNGWRVSGDNYLSGKHSKLYEEKVIRFYSELDGNNRTHLHETLLAYAGKFTIPFVVRMMEMTRWVNDKTNRPYVRYFSRADRNDGLYLLFELPGKGHKVLFARWKNLLNSDAYEYNPDYEQMYLYLNESGFPKNQGFNVAEYWKEDEGDYTLQANSTELWVDGVLLADTPKSCVGLMKKHIDLRRADFIIDLPDAGCKHDDVEIVSNDFKITGENNDMNHHEVVVCIDCGLEGSRDYTIPVGYEFQKEKEVA